MPELCFIQITPKGLFLLDVGATPQQVLMEDTVYLICEIAEDQKGYCFKGLYCVFMAAEKIPMFYSHKKCRKIGD